MYIQGLGVYSMNKAGGKWEMFTTIRQCDKLSELVLSTFSSPCFGVKNRL
jgi:hypothetical protein